MSTFHIIILSVVGSVIIGIIILSTCLTCKQHKKEEQHRKLALQQERQALEHEMTTLINSPRTGHLRSHASASQGKPNGIILGTSHNGSSGNRYEPEPRRTARHQNGNHLGQGTGGISTNGGNGYTRYLKVKDKPDECFPDQNIDIANKDYCDNPYSSHTGYIDRPRLRRTLSDKGHRGRPRTPSPRPDVVQVECVPPHHINRPSRHARAHSADRMLDRSRHHIEDDHGIMYNSNARRTSPVPNDSDFYLPYKSTGDVSCSNSYYQGYDQREGSRSQIMERKSYNPSPYPALEHSPRGSRYLYRSDSENHANIDPGYKDITRASHHCADAASSLSYPYSDETGHSTHGMQYKPQTAGSVSASSGGSGIYGHDTLETRSTTSSSFHSPTNSHVSASTIPHRGGCVQTGPKLKVTSSSSNKVSRTPSVDYKQAPIVPERGYSTVSSSTAAESPPHYATIQTKQGRSKKMDSPDIFYSRPKRSEVRHEDV